MIETLSLRNFKILREVDVRLRPLTLVVGPNASGKSTLLQALAGLTKHGSENGGAKEFAHAFGGRPEVFTSHAASGLMVLECSGRHAGGEFHFSLRVDPRQEPPIVPTKIVQDDDYVPPPRPAVVMSLDFKKMAARSFVKETNQALPSNGEGLSTVLADLHLEHQTRYRELVGRLSDVIPSVQDLKVRRTDDGYELLFDMRGGKAIPASSISEGTLLTLGLLTLLVVPNAPQLVLIDDLERGLHPAALGDLVRQFRALQEQDPELQIVATSHSPYLLDHLSADEILLTSLDEEGYAAVRPLTAHPDYERWKDVMAPGEFWSTVGERWVTEQTPR
jgi:predicted ATPase